jgi:AcrR family transcriptional regulator
MSTASSIERAALELFAERGFASVTIDDIADAVDISRRTFFRYFASKEHVLFGAPLRSELELARALAEQPTDKSPVQALHDTLIDFSRAYGSDAERTGLRLRILEHSPDAMALAFQQRRSSQNELTPLVAGRMGVDELADLRPSLIVSLSIAATHIGTWYWLTNGATEPLHEVIRHALDDTAVGLNVVAARRANGRRTRT